MILLIQQRTIGGFGASVGYAEEMMDHIENMIAIHRHEPPAKRLTERLRMLCNDCLRAPANRHSNAPVGLEPLCNQCQLKWEAADEIEYLRDRVEELRIKYDGRLRELRQCEEDRRKAWMEIDELKG